MNFLSKFNHIPFKYVAAMNFAILVMATTFMSINTISQSTENRSKAAESPPPSPLVSITLDAKNPPRLFASDPDWAKPGDAILIRGQNLGTIPFGDISLGTTPIPPQNIIEWLPDQIVVTLPMNVTTSPLIIKFNQDQILQTTNNIRIVNINESGL